MAVIIDMDIPSNCMACKLSYSSPFGDVMCAANGYRANKQKCPLKSADEMIAEIESAKHPFPYEGDYDKGVNIGLNIATQAIHKYCDMEQNNEKD